MKIELLYPDVSGLYGECAHYKLLEEIFKSDTIYKTNINDTPKFLVEEIDLLFIGSMTESMQLKVTNILKPYREKFLEMIENNKTILAIGNSFEIFGKSIKDENSEYKALSIFNMKTVIDKKNRHNSLFLGKFEEDDIVGFRTQFTNIYLDEDDYPYYLFKKTRGRGMNNESEFEGIRKNNFFGSSLVGPLLIMNPFLLKYILSNLKEKREIPFEKEMIEIYNIRVNEHKDKRTFH